MLSPSSARRSHLIRLPAENYRGRAFVHWTMAVANRETGWLDEALHGRFREILIHTLARHHLACPVCCLMPDHLHLMWAGLTAGSDQRLASFLFRTHFNRALGQCRLQLQAFDHVLRPEERLREPFAAICEYIILNPVRAGLCGRWDEYRYSGGLAVGYPDLDIRQSDYWERFWTIYNRLVED
jgi:putative transposase